MDKNQIESLWVKISDQSNKGNFMVGVYYRLNDKEEPVDEAFLLQLQEALRSQALVLMRDFNCPDICCSTVRCRQSRRLLARDNALLDPLVTNARQLIGNIKIRGNLHCSDHALVEFAILRNMGQVRIKLSP